MSTFLFSKQKLLLVTLLLFSHHPSLRHHFAASSSLNSFFQSLWVIWASFITHVYTASEKTHSENTCALWIHYSACRAHTCLAYSILSWLNFQLSIFSCSTVTKWIFSFLVAPLFSKPYVWRPDILVHSSSPNMHCWPWSLCFLSNSMICHLVWDWMVVLCLE